MREMTDEEKLILEVESSNSSWWMAAFGFDLWTDICGRYLAWKVRKRMRNLRRHRELGAWVASLPKDSAGKPILFRRAAE